MGFKMTPSGTPVFIPEKSDFPSSSPSPSSTPPAGGGRNNSLDNFYANLWQNPPSQWTGDSYSPNLTPQGWSLPPSSAGERFVYEEDPSFWGQVGDFATYTPDFTYSPVRDAMNAYDEWQQSSGYRDTGGFGGLSAQHANVNPLFPLSPNPPPHPESGNIPFNESFLDARSAPAWYDETLDYDRPDVSLGAGFAPDWYDEILDYGDRSLGEDYSALDGRNTRERIWDFITDKATSGADWVGDQATNLWDQNMYPIVEDVSEDFVPMMQEFYNTTLNPLYQDVAEDFGPLFEDAYNYVRDTSPSEFAEDIRFNEWEDGLNTADQWIKTNVPQAIRNLGPEGSRLDTGIEAVMDQFGNVSDYVQDMPFQGMWNYFVDPSQPDFPGMPSWGGDDPTISGPFLLEEGDVSLEEASTLNDMINAFNDAAGMGVSSMGASSMPAPDPSSQGVVGDMSYAPAPGGFQGGVLPGADYQTASDLLASMDASNLTLEDRYADMYGDMRDSTQAAYDLGIGSAEAMEAAAAANYGTEQGAAAQAQQAQLGHINTIEQGMLKRLSDLQTAQEAGVAGAAEEQRRLNNEMAQLQTAKNNTIFSLVSSQLAAEQARQEAFASGRRSLLDTEEAGLMANIATQETARTDVEKALTEQVASRFAGARQGMQDRITDAENALRAQGVDPAAYTAAPGAETMALLDSQEISMMTLQNRLRDANAAQAIDRNMRGRQVYSDARRRLSDNMFTYMEDLQGRKDAAALNKFNEQADIDIAKAAKAGEINIEEMAELQAIRESISGQKADIWSDAEYQRMGTTADYNAALSVARQAQQVAMAAAAEQRSAAEMNKEVALAEINAQEAQGLISREEAEAAAAAQLAQDYILVDIGGGVEIPVDRDWYTEEHLIGPAESADLSSDVNFMQMTDDAGNIFNVDVGGVDKYGVDYLTMSAATNPQLTGSPLLPLLQEDMLAGIQQAQDVSGPSGEQMLAMAEYGAGLTGTAQENLKKMADLSAWFASQANQG